MQATKPAEMPYPAAVSFLAMNKQQMFHDLYMQTKHRKTSADIYHGYYTGVHGKELTCVTYRKHVKAETVRLTGTRQRHWPEALHAAITTLGPQGMPSAAVFHVSDAIMQSLGAHGHRCGGAVWLLLTGKLTETTSSYKDVVCRQFIDELAAWGLLESKQKMCFTLAVGSRSTPFALTVCTAVVSVLFLVNSLLLVGLQKTVVS